MTPWSGAVGHYCVRRFHSTKAFTESLWGCRMTILLAVGGGGGGGEKEPVWHSEVERPQTMQTMQKQHCGLGFYSHKVIVLRTSEAGGRCQLRLPVEIDHTLRKGRTSRRCCLACREPSQAIQACRS